jgi:hypothetical protein
VFGSVAVFEAGGSSDEDGGVELRKCAKAACEGFGRVGFGPWALTPSMALSSGTAAEARKRSARVPVRMIAGDGFDIGPIIAQGAGMRNLLNEVRHR